MNPRLMDEYMTTKQLEEEFGISKMSQARYRMRKNRDKTKIPYYLIFGKVYYRRDEIAEWLKGQKQN